MIRFVDQFAVAVVLGMAIYWAGYKFMPSIEGHFWPVVGPATLIDSAPYPPPEYRHIWSARAEKLRACHEFRRVEWFLGPRSGRRVQVLSEFQDNPQVRDVGPLQWDRLTISLDPPPRCRRTAMAT